MKKQSKILLLAALLFIMIVPAWSQTSTQGKEFWVSLIPSRSPDGEDPNSHGFNSYLAISAPKKCSVRVSNPNANPAWSQVYNIPAGNSWLEITDIPLDQWYSNTMPASETVLNKGLKVEATEEVSVYCCLRWKYSMDATNILPINALQSDYFVQTYAPSNKDGIKRNVFTILAAEDCIVDITLTAQTEGGRTGSIQNIALSAGQVYHVKSAENASLNGSRVVARNGKKIAVFAGCPLGNIPDVYSDRDLVYEQLFPIDYWGQNFIVTRSMQKDANRVIVTAQENNTSVTIYGQFDPNVAASGDHTLRQDTTLTLNAGQSYEFEMSVGNTDGAIWQSASKREGSTGLLAFVDSAVYIKTSCPCAVLSYDVGNGYYRKDAGMETYEVGGDYYGAPAMTWVSPIEQMISDIVFGVMGTDKTTRHFINIVLETRDVPNAKLNGRSLAAYFKPVDNNRTYSYARLKLAETQAGGQNPFYHLQSKYGFIATVYGNGDDESYAYSVGSSAIKRAIAVDGYKFTKDMTIDDVKQIFCVDKPLLFNPQIGTDVIDIVEWDFGDGTTATTTIDQGIEIEHIYYAPGWYDVTANVQAHKECPYSQYPAEEVAFSFYVNRPDTLFRLDTVCLAPDDHSGESTFDTIAYDCDSIVITKNLVLHKADTTFDVEANDQYVYNGTTYTESQVIVDTRKRKDPENRGCDSTITINLTVHKCLNLQVPNDSVNQHTCFGSSIDIPYSYATGGNAGNVRMVRLDDMREFEARMYDDPSQGLQPRTTGTFALSTNEWEPGLYHAKVYVEDLYCGGEAESDVLNIAIYYPSDIFEYRFNNVLAVFKKGFGGNGGTGVYQGADFDMYEWHLVRNEIDAIVGTNNGIYYNGDPFLFDDEVYVRLKETTKPYMLPSCSQIIKDVPDFTPEPQQAPAAQKKLINHRMVIIKDDRTYDMYGQRVQ